MTPKKFFCEHESGLWGSSTYALAALKVEDEVTVLKPEIFDAPFVSEPFRFSERAVGMVSYTGTGS